MMLAGENAYDIHKDCCERILHILGFRIIDENRSKSCHPEQTDDDSNGWNHVSSLPVGYIPSLSLPGKKGACFSLRPCGEDGSWIENLPKLLILNPSWNYSWGFKRLEALPQSLEFEPMLWGYEIENIKDQLQTVKKQGSTMLLGFNEPDNAFQSNVDVETAVGAWPMFEALEIPLISPSCVNAEGAWMEAFMNHVDQKGLRVDAIGVHYYGGPEVKAFQEKLERIHHKYKHRLIMITEFAVADWHATTPEENKYSREVVLKFMMEMLPWLESQEWIVGYAWFPFDEESAAGTSSALFHCDGALTILGKFYSNF